MIIECNNISIFNKTTLPHLIIYPTAINYRNLQKVCLTLSTTYIYCRKLLKNYLLRKFRKNKSRHQATYVVCQNSNENELTSIKSFNYLSIMVLLKSLLINYHYLVNGLIIFVNILIYVGSSI